MGARGLPGPLEGSNLLDLIQPEAQSPSLRDKYEERQFVVGIDAVARCCAARGRQDSRPFVETERLAADAALRRYLTNQQPVLRHDWSVNPAPWDKVKRN